MGKLPQKQFKTKNNAGSVIPVLIIALTVLTAGAVMIKYRTMQRGNASRLINISSLNNVRSAIEKYLDCSATLDGNGINDGNLAAMCPSTTTNMTPPYITLYRSVGGVPRPLTGPLDGDGYAQAGEWLLRSVCSHSAQKVLISAKPKYAQHKYQGIEQVLIGPTAGLCTTEINDLIGGPNPPVGDLKINGADSPAPVYVGTSVTISWDSTDATNCTLNPLGVSGTSNASLSDGPLLADKTYTLTCVNGPYQHQDTITIAVNPLPPAPTATLEINGSGNDLSVADTEPMTISWTSTNAIDGCTVGPPVNLTGTSNPGQSIGPLAVGSYTITLTCSSPAGTATDNINVTVTSSIPVGAITAYGLYKSTAILSDDRFEIMISVDPSIYGLDFHIFDLSNNKISDTLLNKMAGGIPSFSHLYESEFTTVPVVGNQYKVCDASLTNCSAAITAENQQHSLVSAVISGTDVQFTYSIRYFTCGRLVRNGGAPWTTTSECVGPLGSNLQYVVPLANFEAGFGVGSEVWLRHGNSSVPTVGPVTVTGPLPTPTVDLRVDGGNGPVNVTTGSNVSVSWTSGNATSCVVNPGGMTGLNNPGANVVVNTPVVFDVSCTNGSETVTDSVTVNIVGGPPPTEISDLSPRIAPNAMAIGPDGKVTVVGSAAKEFTTGNCAPITQRRAYAFRFNTNGSIDSSFGTNGEVYFGTSDPCWKGYLGNAVTQSIVIDGSGNSIFGLAEFTERTWSGPHHSYLMKVTPDGLLDTSFGTAGKTLIHYNTMCNGCVTTDIVQHSSGMITTRYHAGSSFSLRQYNSNGSVNTSFGSSGKVELRNNDALLYDIPRDYGLALSSTETILIPFYEYTIIDNATYEFLASGTPHPITPYRVYDWGGSNKKFVLPSLEVGPSGETVFVGLVSDSSNSSAPPKYLGVERILPSGTRDPGFGASGKQEYLTRAANYFAQVGVQSDGKIIISYVLERAGFDPEIEVFRLNLDGTVDSTFGTSGTTKVACGPGHSNTKFVTSLIVDPSNDKIYGAVAFDPPNAEYLVGSSTSCFFRLEEDGNFDATFGTSGIVSKTN